MPVILAGPGTGRQAPTGPARGSRSQRYPPAMEPAQADPLHEEHVHAAYRDFGLKGMARALCTCGYATRPLPGPPAALESLLADHGARPRRQGEQAFFPY